MRVLVPEVSAADTASPRTGTLPLPAEPAVVLFDRDGTLVRDVPYNRRPRLVTPMPGAKDALDLLRRAGVRVGVVTNQSGIARGLLTRDEADAVNAEVERQLGPFDVWQVCPHDDRDGCACRKPKPGLILAALAELGVEPTQAVVVGDIGRDVEAGRRTGAYSVLVPTPVTRDEEVDAAPLVAGDLGEAARLILGRRA